MIIPDVNLLIYAYDAESPVHKAAASWWRRCLSASEPVGLPPLVLFGFVRIATSSRVFRDPMTPAEAASHVRAWLARPCVQILQPPANHVEQVLALLEALGVAGNLVTDAQIAALAIEYGATLHTSDADFLRFAGLRWHNPITGRGHAPPASKP